MGIASKIRKPGAAKPGSAASQIQVVRAEVFAGVPWLIHGFSTRPGGESSCYGGKSLNLGMTDEDVPGTVERNRELFLKSVGAVDGENRLWALAQVKQVHSSVVRRVAATPEKPKAGDGMITDRPELLLAVKAADCVPVLVADTRRRVVGAFHAGWRGTVARIVEKGVGEMRRHFGSDPADLRAAIGPCIRKCCYAVGKDLRAEFESQFSYSEELFGEVFDSNAIHVRYPMLFLNQRAPGHGDLGPELHLDLVAANRRQLQDAGVPLEQIAMVEGCTACDTQRFFSYRAEFGKTGRMMAVIGIRPE